MHQGVTPKVSGGEHVFQAGHQRLDDSGQAFGFRNRNHDPYLSLVKYGRLSAQVLLQLGDVGRWRQGNRDGVGIECAKKAIEIVVTGRKHQSHGVPELQIVPEQAVGDPKAASVEIAETQRADIAVAY